MRKAFVVASAVISSLGTSAICFVSLLFFHERLGLSQATARVLALVCSAALGGCVLLFVVRKFYRARQPTSGADRPKVIVQRRLALILMCLTSLMATAFCTRPYWRDALDGQFFWATKGSIALYGLIALLQLSCLATANFVDPRRRAGIAFLFPLTMLVIILGKWLICAAGGLTLFHNDMGLGMEILGPLPNLLLDAILAGFALGSLGAADLLRAEFQESEGSRPNS